jgi:alkylation response protein AidB-like acyl-CoA dehydrogenase
VELALTEDLRAFQAEARAFIRAEAPALVKRAGTRSPTAEELPAFRRWCAALFDAGYLGADWPEEWGGRAGHTPMHDYVFDGELGSARAPTPVGAWRLVANALLAAGTEEQRAYFLPRIRSYTDFWCQLFSEPDAGSDLASLRLRATRTDDGWRLNGQKIWTTHAQIADYGFLLARTDPEAPKHQGISAYLVDMRTPGISVRPLRELTGSSDFNEVFFDDVDLPAAALIGAPGQGWQIARDCLAKERSDSRREDSITNTVSRLTPLAEEAARRQGVPFSASAEAATIGRLIARAEISDLLGYAQLQREMIGIGESDDAAVSKVFFGELNLDIQRSALDFQSAAGLLVEGDPQAADDGIWQDGFLWARGYTISAGSNEVMRNIIAERHLGLPKG